MLVLVALTLFLALKSLSREQPETLSSRASHHGQRAARHAGASGEQLGQSPATEHSAHCDVQLLLLEASSKTSSSTGRDERAPMGTEPAAAAAGAGLAYASAANGSNKRSTVGGLHRPRQSSATVTQSPDHERLASGREGYRERVPGVVTGSGRTPIVQRTLAATSTSNSRQIGSSARSGSSHAPSQSQAPAAATTQRIAPAASTLRGTAVTSFSDGTTLLPSTLGDAEEMNRLVVALQNMAAAEPAQLFAGRYRLQAEIVQGGQAVVVFARDRSNGFFQFAIKCALPTRLLSALIFAYVAEVFNVDSRCDRSAAAACLRMPASTYSTGRRELHCLLAANLIPTRSRCSWLPQTHMLHRLFQLREDFEEEVALYRNPALSSIMPDLLHADDNTSCSILSRSGYVFPPFLVTERGTTLRTWLQEERNFFEVTTMVEALARLLDSLHTAGYAHRDIKACARMCVWGECWHVQAANWYARQSRVIVLRVCAWSDANFAVYVCSRTT